MQRSPNSFLSRAAGSIAISFLVLITLVGGLRLSLPIGIAGAVVTYLGVSLLLRRPIEHFPPSPSASDLLTEIAAMSQKITAHAIRLKIAEVVAQTRALLNHFHTGTEGTEALREYTQDCLASAAAATRRFTELSSHVTEPTDPTVVQFSAYLTALSQTLARMREEAVDGSGGGDPAARVDGYQSALRAINQTYFGPGSMP